MWSLRAKKVNETAAYLASGCFTSILESYKIFEDILYSLKIFVDAIAGPCIPDGIAQRTHNGTIANHSARCLASFYGFLDESIDAGDVNQLIFNLEATLLVAISLQPACMPVLSQPK